MKRWTRLVLVTILAWAFHGRATADYVVNGGFESGDFAGWTQSGNTGFTSVSSTAAFTGNFGAVFGPVGSMGFIAQTITTTPGAQYDLSFALASDGNVPNEALVTFGGTTVFDQTNIPLGPYASFHFTVTASSASSVLQFGFQNDPGFLQLDNVSLVAHSSVKGVPEPGSLALASLGLIGLALTRSRQRRQGFSASR